MGRTLFAVLLTGLFIYGVHKMLFNPSFNTILRNCHFFIFYFYIFFFFVFNHFFSQFSAAHVNAQCENGFAKKVIIVTGASSGIGADAAIHLAKLGANVSLVGQM